jgi:hypothetical protein
LIWIKVEILAKGRIAQLAVEAVSAWQVLIKEAAFDNGAITESTDCFTSEPPAAFCAGRRDAAKSRSLPFRSRHIQACWQ